jgi:hypothetical protein
MMKFIDILLTSVQAKKKCNKKKGTLSADTNVCVIKTESTDNETVRIDINIFQILL